MEEKNNIKLTDKQEMFCQEYVIDLNATQSAIRAGYSQDTARSIGTENLSKPAIRTRIKELQKIRSENLLIDQSFVIEGLIEVAQRCQQAKPVEEWDYESKSYKQTGEYEFDSNGANKALELLGKHLAMFTDKSQVEVTGLLDAMKSNQSGLLRPTNDTL